MSYLAGNSISLRPSDLPLTASKEGCLWHTVWSTLAGAFFGPLHCFFAWLLLCFFYGNATLISLSFATSNSTLILFLVFATILAVIGRWARLHLHSGFDNNLVAPIKRKQRYNVHYTEWPSLLWMLFISAITLLELEHSHYHFDLPLLSVQGFLNVRKQLPEEVTLSAIPITQSSQSCCLLLAYSFRAKLSSVY